LLKEALNEYNPNNVRLHKINMITLPVSIRDSYVLENGRKRKPTPEEMAELVLSKIETPLYKNLAKQIRRGEVVPVYLWDFAGNLIEAPDAFPLHIEKEWTSVRWRNKEFFFNRYRKADPRRETKRDLV